MASVSNGRITRRRKCHNLVLAVFAAHNKRSILGNSRGERRIDAYSGTNGKKKGGRTTPPVLDREQTYERLMFQFVQPRMKSRFTRHRDTLVHAIVFSNPLRRGDHFFLANRVSRYEWLLENL